jgi:hypothetical protein
MILVELKPSSRPDLDILTCTLSTEVASGNNLAKESYSLRNRSQINPHFAKAPEIKVYQLLEDTRNR